MKVNKFIFKVLILFIIFYIVLSTFFPCFGALKDDYSFYYLYSYVFDTSYIDSKMSSYVSGIKSDNKIISGDYYYFAYKYTNSPNQDYFSNVYLLKSDCDYIYFNFGDYNSLWGQYNVNFYNGSNDDLLFTMPALIDEGSRKLSFRLSTNFDKDIFIEEGNIPIYLLHNSPYIADNDDTIARLNGDYFLIFPNCSDNVNLHFSLCQTEFVDGDLPYEKENIIKDIFLDSSSPYYNCPLGDEVWYEVPYSAFSGITINNGEEYNWRLQYDLDGKTFYVNRNIISLVDYTFTDSSGEVPGGGDVEDDKDDVLQNAINNSTSAIIDSNKQTQNAIQNQTEAIKENTETNKSIWETLKEVVSYLNPFSENFFVYKLIDLLIDGLKSLFIPSDDFFSTYFEDLRDWFSDRLGFLWTPFDVIIEILENISSINFGEPVISCPDIYEPFTNTKIISAFSYNLNNLLENSTFKTVHDIYFVVVDAIIIFAMIHLTHKKIEEVFSN